MALLQYEIILTEKTGFTEVGFKAAIKRSLQEIRCELIGFECQRNYEEKNALGIKKRLSKYTCLVGIPDEITMAGIPEYQIVLGDIQQLKEDYPYFEIDSISPKGVKL